MALFASYQNITGKHFSKDDIVDYLKVLHFWKRGPSIILASVQNNGLNSISARKVFTVSRGKKRKIENTILESTCMFFNLYPVKSFLKTMQAR
jgi:hypothetical protein